MAALWFGIQQYKESKKADQVPDQDEEEPYTDELVCCTYCGGIEGKHRKECPNDNSPWAEYIRQGYD